MDWELYEKQGENIRGDETKKEILHVTQRCVRTRHGVL